MAPKGGNLLSSGDIPDPRRPGPGGGDNTRAVGGKVRTPYEVFMASKDAIPISTRLGRIFQTLLCFWYVKPEPARERARFFIPQSFERQQPSGDGVILLDFVLRKIA
ncbi:hypothetical protein MnTg02_03047 [bacterium MnTg02]|nr:hypothetical protein MnTg02_03047 [bacterium MnTg02]